MGISGLSVGIYFWLHKNHKSIQRRVEASEQNISHIPSSGIHSHKPKISIYENNSLGAIKPFNDFDPKELYDEIKVKNGSPYFSDDFFALFIQKFISKMLVVPDENSKLKIDIIKREPKEAVINCTWYSNNQTYSKLYTLKLSIDK